MTMAFLMIGLKPMHPICPEGAAVLPAQGNALEDGMMMCNALAQRANISFLLFVPLILTGGEL
jgi:hypothetical protein